MIAKFPMILKIKTTFKESIEIGLLLELEQKIINICMEKGHLLIL